MSEPMMLTTLILCPHCKRSVRVEDGNSMQKQRIETLEDYIDNLANRGVAPASEWRRQGGPGGQEP